jgi:hypothetical protein
MTNKETLALLNTFKGPIISFLKEAKHEVSFFFDNGLADYIDNLRGKYSFTKTFLYRNENVNFYDVFFPASLSLGNNRSRIYTLTELFKSSRFVTIIGNA